MSSRGIAPVVGVVALLLIVTALGGVAAAVVPGSVESQHNEPTSIDLTASSDGNITFTHARGPAINTSEIELRIAIDGEAIPHQPDLEVWKQTGFRGFPSGPLNPSTDSMWSAGQTATLTLASTNRADELSPGATVTAELYLDGRLFLTLERTVSG